MLKETTCVGGTMLGIENVRGKVPVLMERRFYRRYGTVNIEKKTTLLSKICTNYC